MKIKFLILSILLFVSNFSFAQYKVSEAYLVQKIEATLNPTYQRFFFPYQIASNGAYYVAKEKDVIDFFKNDSIDESKLILLIEFRDYFFKLDTRVWTQITNSNSSWHFKKLYDIITADNAETYRIGNCGHYEYAYVIRKMKYAYLDSVDMFAPEYKLFEYGTDDIQIPDDIDSTLVRSAKDFYDVDYFQCFLFYMELQPSHKKIRKHIWKRRYEFFDESYKYIK